MNCSEFNRELDRLVEVCGQTLPEPAATHAVDCAVCRQQWQDHRLIETALVAWRPVQCPPSLADSVLTELRRERVVPVVHGSGNPTRWLAVAVAAACLVVALGFGMASRPSGDSKIARDTGRPQAPVIDSTPIEVASSVAAVLDDLHAEYQELAAETSATARGLADALPATPSAAWIDGGFSATTSEANRDNTREGPPGAVSVIGRSFGSQIGQAMDFLRVAVPDAVPRG